MVCAHGLASEEGGGDLSDDDKIQDCEQARGSEDEASSTRIRAHGSGEVPASVTDSLSNAADEAEDRDKDMHDFDLPLFRAQLPRYLALEQNVRDGSIVRR
ncbi:hypothetical protein PsorP6_003148 [Peronosclerospora sorghi]|uniref:Uncharacterized protein n=1 Tax=Peronosclerospora sorghi TaxID=230839 RepID=A0ACC0VJB8_9STRA|nr:hypothetical protein PsorP6_003148 [Peronosclerospora sorghi]